MAEQTHCPDPGCVSALPLLPNGWTLIGDLWWCPLHALGEARRLKKQEDEVAWYDGSIHVRERAIADRDDSKESVLAEAKRAGLNRRDPEIRRRLAEIDSRADLARDELTTLRRNRDNATQRHELENENQRNSRQIAPKIEEN